VRLTQRLLVGAFAVVGFLVILIVAVVERQLRDRLVATEAASLADEARLIAVQWREGADADSLADLAGEALGHRVTLVLPDGRVAGDADFDGAELGALENHAARPEVQAAARGETGEAQRQSRSTGANELYVAVPAGGGRVARVSVPTARIDRLVADARRDVIATGLAAMLAAVVLAALFARAVSRPIVALRDVAKALASGDLTRRPSLSAPGEVGDLAAAIHRLAEQLSARLEALRADEALLTQLTESLTEGALAVDARQQAVRINATARRLLDVHDPVPFAVDLLPRDRVFRAALAAALDGATTDEVETVIGERTVALTARPLTDGGAVVTLLDLTPVRRVEAVRRDFVANVSHELRTPLTIVGGFAETLVHDDPPPEVRRQFAGTILGNTRRMQRIVDDLLDLSRIESGGWRPVPTHADVASIAADAIGSALDVAAGKGITLSADIAPDAATVWADPTALRQVIGNLVDNAVRHTATGTVLVFARALPDGATEVGVRDTGSGIAPEHLPRIFERFYRVDPGRSRDEGGTGLGLSIVRHLVEAHGGTVRAESAVGVGTAIAGRFPRPVTPP
jgi:signal transduction histidine kinase